MIGIAVKFKNHQKPDGTFETFTVEDCLVGQYGSPQSSKQQIEIHLPKTCDKDVNYSWAEYRGEDWYVKGTTVKQIESNTPTRWDRYAIAERVETW